MSEAPKTIAPQQPFLLDDDGDVVDADGWLVCCPAYDVWPDDDAHSEYVLNALTENFRLKAKAERLREALITLSATSSELMVACDKAGAFDSLIAEVFPDHERRGNRNDAGFKRIDRARNEVKAAQSVARAALSDKKGE